MAAENPPDRHPPPGHPRPGHAPPQYVSPQRVQPQYGQPQYVQPQQAAAQYPPPGYTQPAGYPQQTGYPPGYPAYPGQSPNPGQPPNPNQYPGDDGPPPGRGRTIAIIAALGVVGLLVGLGAGALVNRRSDDTVTATPTATAEPSTPGEATTAAGGATPGSQLPSSGTQKIDYSPLPADPSTVQADFGYITAVSSTGGTVTVTFDRAQFYTGAEAKAHNKGKAPDDDYLIENTNPTKRTFTIDPKASLVGTARLNPDGEIKAEPLTETDFAENAKGALADDGRIPVWLRHTDGLEGDITALQEQYMP